MKFLKIILIIFIFLSIAAVGAGYGVYKWAAQDLPDYKDISDYNPPLVTTVLTRDDEVLGYFYREMRFLVSLNQVSPWVVKSFLAAEDAGFYEHEGVEFLGIVRAAIQNFQAGEIVQGGSTITQQVIKSLLLTPERSYTRKIKEAILAYRLENHLTKDEILTIYLNQIFLGARAYGVEAAARIYFGKNARDLTLAQSALIAALPKAPSRLNPYRNPQGARHRQVYVLNRLRDLGWITSEEFEEAMTEPLEYESMPDPSWRHGPYYLEEVRRQLIRKFGEDKVYEGGLLVNTGAVIKHLDAAQSSLRQGLRESTKRRGWRGPLDNIEPDQYDNFLSQDISDDQLQGKRWLQVLVEDVQESGASVRFGQYKGWMDVSTMSWCRTLDPSRAPEEVRAVRDATRVLKKGDIVWASIKLTEDDEPEILELALEQEPVVEGALVSADPRTGEVLAIAGGYDFNRSHFNRATQAKRQPGSAFKPFVYSVAMDNGFTPASTVLDAPIVYDDFTTMTSWRPKNFEGVFYGPTLLRTALVKSRNLVTIRIAQQMGINEMVSRFRDFGIDEEFPRDLSISLGSVPMSLLNLCQAYSAFARDGSYMPLRFVNRVADSWGNELYRNEDHPVQATTPENAYIITNILQEVVRDGTGWRARVLNRPVAGKTGTTNDQNDAWYIGYSPYLITGVYVGFDQLTPMGRFETGARAASPIWVNYRQQVEEDYPVQDFSRPAGVTMVRIDSETGLLADSGAEGSYFLPFIAGTEPTRRSVSSSTGEQAQTGPSTEEDLLRQIF